MARRLNKKFLIILTSGVLGILLAGMLLAWFRPRANVKELVAAGDKMAAAGNWQGAKEKYLRAFPSSPTDVNLLVKLGDTCHELTRLDQAEIDNDIKYWEAALEVEPNCLPALRRLLEAYIDLTEIRPNMALFFQRMAEKAKALARADEKDVRARAYEQIGLVGAWLAGTPKPDATLEQSLAVLVKLIPRKPEEVAIPWTVAQVRLRLAQDRANANDPDGAKAQRAKAIEVFQEAMKLQPDNAELLFRYYTVYKMVRAVESPDQEVLGDKELKELREMLDRSLVRAKETDRLYVDMRLESASLNRQMGDSAKAERELDRLIEERPDDLKARLRVATYFRMDPTKRQKALDLLLKPAAGDLTLKGPKARLRLDMDRTRVIDLTQLRLDLYQEVDQKERAALRQLIDEGLQQATEMMGGRASPADEEPVLLKLRARVLLLDSDEKSRREAVRLMEKAAEKYEQRRYVDAELIQTLARVYREFGQTGQARLLLSNLLKNRPGQVRARIELVQILLRSKSYDEARMHVERLEKQLKDNSDVKALRVNLLLGTGQMDQAREVIRLLPEAQPREATFKAQLLLWAGDLTAAEKLLAGPSDKELQEGRGDFPASQLLVQVFMRAARKIDAEHLAEEAMAKNPKSHIWSLIERIVKGTASKEDYRRFRLDEVEEIADPVTQAIQRYQLAREVGQFDEALKVLVEADKQLGGPGKLLEIIFIHALDMRDWTLAEQTAARLEKLDWDQAGGLSYTTRLKLARNDLDGALSSAGELVKRMGNFARSWVLLGQAQQALGRYQVAITSYNKALEKQLDNVEALRGLVECHVAANQLPIARQYVSRGLRLSGTQAAWFREMARRIEEQYGEPRAVTADREKDVSTNPSSLRAWMSLIDNYLRVASSSQGKNDAKGAEAALAKARAKVGEAIAKWPDEIALYVRLVDIAQRSGKPDEALQTIQTLAAREKWKSRPEPCIILYGFYDMQGPTRRADAERALKDAVVKSSNSVAVRQHLVRFYLRGNEADRAIRLLQEMVAETKDPELRRELIEVQVEAGRYPDAEKFLKDSLAANPTDAKVMALWGFVKMKQKDSPAALQYFDKAIKLDPLYATALYYRGMLHLEAANLAAAMSDLEKARDLNPSNADIRVGLAEYYLRRGQTGEAAGEMETAVQREPLRRELRMRLIRLYFIDQRWAPIERLIEEAKGNPELSQDVTWWKLESQMWMARQNVEKAFEAVQMALKMSPSDMEATQSLLEILLKSGQYQDVLKVTDNLVKNSPGPAPWWVHMARGCAFKAIPDKQAEAESAFTMALNQVDAAEEDTAAKAAAVAQAAEALASQMAKTMGVPWTAAQLSSRRFLRWTIELARVYSNARDWNNAVALADGLIEKEVPKLPPASKLATLQLAGLIYTAASAAVPAARDKAVRAYTDYLNELDRQPGEVVPRLLAMNNLACLLAEHPTAPNPERALLFSKRAYEEMEKNKLYMPGLADTHGWVLVLCNRVDEGIAVLRTLAGRDQAPPECFYHMGEAWLRKKRPLDALSNLDRAWTMLLETREKGGDVDSVLEERVRNLLEKLRPGATSGKAPASQPATRTTAPKNGQ